MFPSLLRVVDSSEALCFRSLTLHCKPRGEMWGEVLVLSYFLLCVGGGVGGGVGSSEGAQEMSPGLKGAWARLSFWSRNAVFTWS